MVYLPFRHFVVFFTTLASGHLSSSSLAQEVIDEDDRIVEYNRRGHVWPPKPEDYTPNTEGWRKINELRFEQLAYARSDSLGQRYFRYMYNVHSALLAQNFTEYGWGITRAPQAVIDKLQKRLHDGLANIPTGKGFEIEDDVPSIEPLGDDFPLFFHDGKMNDEILHELLPLHEAWSGVELEPINSYGLRAYRNGTSLNMHVDRPDLVISSILHVDHGENDDPWPIIIEDFEGKTNEVYLYPGDMLFYESSKCLHGRPTTFHGEYYSSLYSHYKPKGWNLEQAQQDMMYRIPPHVWEESLPKEEGTKVDDLLLFDISLKEPGCEHSWCGVEGSKKWQGTPGQYGKVLTGDGSLKDLRNIPSEASFVRDEL